MSEKDQEQQELADNPYKDGILDDVPDEEVDISSEVEGYEDFDVADVHAAADEENDEDADNENSVMVEREVFERDVIHEIFRFEIGERVFPLRAYEKVLLDFRCDRESREDRFFLTSLPPLQVIERMVQECHGGVQYLYKVSGYQDTKSGGQQYHMMADIELVSYTSVIELFAEQSAWIKERNKRVETKLSRDVYEQLNMQMDIVQSRNEIYAKRAEAAAKQADSVWRNIINALADLGEAVQDKKEKADAGECE